MKILAIILVNGGRVKALRCFFSGLCCYARMTPIKALSKFVQTLVLSQSDLWICLHVTTSRGALKRWIEMARGLLNSGKYTQEFIPPTTDPSQRN